MKKTEVDRFFKALGRYWDREAEILLLGGTASLLMGGKRPTLDIDFEATLSTKKSWSSFEGAVRKAQEQAGIVAQFSESVERWSQISYLDYKRHRKLFKRFGKINVYLLEAPYWSIGKIARYWAQDILDMVAVFKKEKPDPLRLARLWQRALQKSPRSTVLFNVKKHADHFFRRHGRQIWGQRFPEEKIRLLFR